MINSIYCIGVIVSIAVYVIVGIYAGRSVKDVNDYYVSGRNAPTILVAGTLFASSFSVSGFTGDPGWAYAGNITNGVMVNAICGCGYVIGPLVFGRYLRRSECNTMPEFFGKRYGNFGCRRLSAIILIVSLFAYLISCIKGIGILFQELIGLPYWASILVAGLTFIVFTFYSGSKGVILTDTIMFVVFVFAFIITAPYIFNAQGGISELLTNLMNNPNIPSGLLDYHGNIAGTGATDASGAVIYTISLGIMWLLACSISPWNAGRGMMAKSEHVIFRSGIIATVTNSFVLTLSYIAAVAVNNVNPFIEDPQKVLIWAMFNLVPKLIGTIIMSGIMAAGLSSASTFLSLVGFSIASDIIPEKFKTEKEKLRISKIAVLVTGIVAIFIAYYDISGIRILTIFASTCISASWAIPAIGGIVTEKMSTKGATWSMTAGFLGFLISKILSVMNPFFGNLLVKFLDPFYIALVLSIVFAVFGSIKYPSSEKIINYRKELFVLPQSECVVSDYKRDRVYGVILIIAGIIYSMLLLLGWALPYNGIL